MGLTLVLNVSLSSMIAIRDSGKHAKLQKTIGECWVHF
jgi:hypothetical protein